MSVVPVQQRRSGRVTVVGDALQIEHLRITHPETVALARRELAEHGAAFADGIATAIIVGLAAGRLHRSADDNVGVMQRVLAGFDETLQARAEATVAQLDGVLARIDATERATQQAAAAALADLPTRIERGLNTVLAGEAGNVRDAVRQAAATVQSEALAQLEQVVQRHTAAVRSTVSIENPASPIFAVRRDLTAAVDGARRELSEGLATIRALLESAQAGQQAARKNSAAVGKAFEDQIGEMIADWARLVGDVVEQVGSQPAPTSGTRKTGDVVIRVMTGSQPVIVLEMKRRLRALTAHQYRQELAEARRVRRAHAALAVVPSPDQVPGPGRFARVDNHAWVVSADDPELLMVVLATVREISLITAAAGETDSAVDLGRVQTTVSHALDLLSRFDEMTKHVTTGESALANIRRTADTLRSALTGQLNDARRALLPDSGRA